MANPEQLALLRRSIDTWNHWRRQQPGVCPDLSSAILFRADLSSAVLFRADLSNADLSGTNLSGTNLSGANLSGANLICADLSGANLRSADLSGANLRSADLRSAHFSSTTFAQIDLRSVKWLETAIHGGPSSVDINSVVLPIEEHIRNHFLRGVGFTEIQIKYFHLY